MPLSSQDVSFLTDLIKKRSGIHLTEDKAYLIESRLLPIARKYNLPSLEDLAKKLKANKDEALYAEVTEAMTTNESSFFRDIKPFEQFRQVIMPHLIAKCPGKKKFRIWSAACSTGQEAYSLAISILEEPKCQGFDFEIIGTDLAHHVIDKAKSGTYTQFEVQRGLPITLLVKYFQQKEESWVLNEKVRNMVSFKFCNLTEPFQDLGMFDIILCRNVLIYFDQETKAQVLNKLSKQMNKEGVLFLGCAESVFGVDGLFAPMKDTVGIYSLKSS